jgi:hypothetical protein
MSLERRRCMRHQLRGRRLYQSPLPQLQPMRLRVSMLI